jgi:hypothetical protein
LIENKGDKKMIELTKAAAQIQTLDSETLAKAARGEIDLNELARRELASRGLDSQAKWVGFEKAKELHGIK